MAVTSRVDGSRENQERVAQTVLHFLRARARLDDLIAKSASTGLIPFAASCSSGVAP